MIRIRRLIRELHRRSLWQVLGIYLAASWVALQIVESLTTSLDLPAWFPAFSIVLLITGLPIVLATAFVQEGVHDAARADAQPAEERAAPAKAVTEASRPRPSGLRQWLTWRHALIGGVVAFALWGLVATVWVLRGTLVRTEAAAGLTPEPSLVVFPFAIAGGDSSGFLRNGLVDLLSRNLDGTIGVRTRDAGDVLDFVEKNGTNGGVSAERGAEFARALRAQLFVVGSVQLVGDRLRLHADLFETGSAQAAATARAEGTTGELFTLADRLSAELLAQHRGGTSQRLTRAAAHATGSIAAFRAYVDAEQHFRRAEYDSATLSFERAIAEDSTFALAHYRLAVARLLNGNAALASGALRDALANADRLSDRERDLLLALATLFQGDVDDAEQRYRTILDRFPDETDAHFNLGMLLVSYNAVRGRSPYEAWEPFAAVLRADPRSMCPI